MRSTGTMPVQTRRRFRLAPAVFALGVAVTAVGAGLAWDRSISSEDPVPRITSAPASHDPAAVLRSHMADSLRYRRTITRAAVAGSDVLGGPVVRETPRDADVTRIVRYFPVLTPREVGAMEFAEG